MYRKFAEIYRVVTGRRYDQDEVRRLRAKAAANKRARSCSEASEQEGRVPHGSRPSFC